MNEVIEESFARRMAGLFHAGGRLRWSLYQIAQIVNRVGGYDPDFLIGCPRIEAGPVPPRAGNVAMNSEKLYQALGRNPFVDCPQIPIIGRPTWGGIVTAKAGADLPC